MGRLYENADDLIYLFSYGQQADTDTYTSSSDSLYIDRTTGNLIRRCYISSDPFSARPGSVRVSETKLSYEYLEKILERYTIEDGSLYESLREDNWEAWLTDNHFI